MNNNELENKLRKSLERLEQSAEKLIATTGYTRESRKMKLLAELIREQLKNENTRHSAGALR